MTCSRCGEQLPSSARFCSRCEQPIAETPRAGVLPANIDAAPARTLTPGQDERWGGRLPSNGGAGAVRGSAGECRGCGRAVAIDDRFCRWCTRYLGIDDAPLYLAGIFRRFMAHFVDGFLLLLAIVLPLTLLAAPGGGLLLVVAWLLVILGYLWLFVHGTTLGKAAMGIRVIRTNGEPPGFWTMLLRETVGKFVSGLFFGLGWFWAIWDRDRQAWHDKLAGTVVVHRRDSSGYH